MPFLKVEQKLVQSFARKEKFKLTHYPFTQQAADFPYLR